MIYLYAYTNHKSDLDSLRRVKAIYDELKAQNLECEILVNEYRAQLLGRDWGLPLATTIETIKDIDAVAEVGDTVLIDSPEKLEGKVLNYPDKFKTIYINSSFDEVTFDGAKVVNVYKDREFIFSKVERNPSKDSIFIYGDSDYEKVLLKNLSLFEGKNLDLYWGTYFFVKYEDDLSKVFNSIVESEEYYDILQEYKNIITSNLHIAIEAKANGINVAYLDLQNIDNVQKELLKSLNISILSEIKSFENEKIDIKNSVQKIIDLLIK